MMLPSRGPGRRAVVGAVGAVALASANVCQERRGCKCRAANADATCAAELLARGWAGVRAGVGAATSTYLFTHPRERLLRDPRRPIQGRNASSGAGLLGRQPAGWGRPRGHQATRSRLPRPLWVRESIRQSVIATSLSYGRKFDM